MDRRDPAGHPLPVPESARHTYPITVVRPPARETWTLWSIRHAANAAAAGFLVNLGVGAAYTVNGDGWDLGLGWLVMCVVAFCAVGSYVVFRQHARNGGRV